MGEFDDEGIKYIADHGEIILGWLTRNGVESNGHCGNKSSNLLWHHHSHEWGLRSCQQCGAQVVMLQSMKSKKYEE